MDEKELREIEEMTKDAYEKCPTDCCYRGDLRGKCIIRQLYLAGYRKPREDEVVLSKEEYDELLMDWDKKEKGIKKSIDKDMLDSIQQAYNDGRTETAREIISRIKTFLNEQTNTVKQLSEAKSRHAITKTCVECYERSQDNRLAELNRIVKEYGVEVEE